MANERYLHRRLGLVIGATGALGVLAAVTTPAVAAELPIPCIAGSCGPAVTSWVTSGNATGGVSGNNFTINQTSANVTLNWQSFNVSEDGTVTFVQPDASSVALNRIFQNDPSKIFGALNANGRVYLLNQNGILFGSNARVNVGGLVASSLNITPEAVELGIARASSQNKPAFERFKDATNKPLESGDITIEKGATLTATGGQILVFAPNIENRGTIETPDGQTILAAGNSVFLAASDDPNLRGLLVEVGNGGTPTGAGGTVTNGEEANSTRSTADLVGTIAADRGNVTLAGLSVNQLGRVSATTSVRANGSIRLLARDSTSATLITPNQPLANRTGTLTVGTRSLTDVSLDTSTATTVDVNAQPHSQIELSGKTIAIQASSTLRATAGSITARAVTNPSAETETFSPDPDSSRIIVGAGAVLDVSGASVDLPVERNSLRVELRGTQLADSPLVRDSPIRGQAVYVDVRKSGTRSDGTVWQGTPIGDVSGDIGTIARDVRERNLAGGSVSLVSQGAVLVDQGATVNVSGGVINWGAGTVRTSQLLGVDGRIYDISQADRDREYVAVIDSQTVRDQRWGTSATYNMYGQTTFGVPEAAYVEGKDAGSVSIIAPRAVFDGTIDGHTTIGPLQRLAPGAVLAKQLYRSYDQLPLGAKLTVGLATPDASATEFNYVAAGVNIAAGPTLSSLKTEKGAAFDPLKDPLPESLDAIWLRPELLGANKVSRLAIYSNGEVTVPKNTTVNLPGAGELTVNAGRIDFAGTLRGIGASVDLLTRPTPSFQALDEDDHPQIVLQKGAVIDVSGRWINERQLSNDPMVVRDTQSALLIDGGKVSFATQSGSLELQQGALIDVSGGARQLGNGTVVAGKGGSISLTARGLSAEEVTPLTLGAQLVAYGLHSNGSLSITANSVCISELLCETTDEGALLLKPSELFLGGFGSYAIRSNAGNLEVAADTLIDLEQRNLELRPEALMAPSGSQLRDITSVVRLLDPERAATNLTLGANVVHTPLFERYSDLIIGSGATLQLDRGAKVDLVSNSRILIDGSIDAAAGSISVLLDRTLSGDAYMADQGIWLGSKASLNVAGAALLQPTDVPGQLVGDVLDGGSISIEARRGFIVTHSDSLLDVSGTSAAVDIIRPDGSVTRQNVYSSAGAVSLTAAEGMLLNGSFNAKGGAATAAGGSLKITVDATGREDVPQPGPLFSAFSGPRSIVVKEQNTGNLLGWQTELPTQFQGTAVVSAQDINAGGFDNVTLFARNLQPPQLSTQPVATGRIFFDGGVTLAPRSSLTLDAPIIGIRSEGEVKLSSSVVRLGAGEYLASNLFVPVKGEGSSWNISGGLVELFGSTTLTGAEKTKIESAGDLRIRGIYDLGKLFRSSITFAGDTELSAEQLYPTTLTIANLKVVEGGLTLSAAASASGPVNDVLSAGGELHLAADTVNIGTKVRVPFGLIDITAKELTIQSGGVLSTSADKTIPLGRLQGGFAWVYESAIGQTRAFSSDETVTLPQQNITLTADQLSLDAGATIDFSGGGDLQAAEFQPGPGGTRDILSADVSPNLFAIVPGLNLDYGAYDPREYRGSALQPGDRIHLDTAQGGLPAGDYTLLPARYALLEGAYTVTAASGYGDLQAGTAFTRVDGSSIVSGYRTVSGTSIRDSRTSGFLVTPGTTFAKQAQYAVASANDLFANAAASGVLTSRLPRDAGVLSINATKALDLSGTVRGAAAKGGLGGQVDIAASRMRVTNDPTSESPAGWVKVLSDQIDRLAVESIVLGGRRTATGDALSVKLQAASTDLLIDSGAILTAPEIILVASGSIDIAEGASIGSSGAVARATEQIQLTGNAALVRVSSGKQVDVVRTNASGNIGADINIAEGARIAASGSITLDSRIAPVLAGSIDAAGASLQIGADTLALTSDGTGLAQNALSANQLSGLGLGELRLLSRNALTLEGQIALAAQNLTLSAPQIKAGSPETNVSLVARNELTLTGGSNTSPTLAPSTGGTLALSGNTVHLAGGNLQFANFDDVTVAAASPMLIEASGALAAAGNLNLTGGAAFATAGADYSISSLSSLSMTAGSTSVAAKPAELGGALTLRGTSIALSAPIIAPSGHVELFAQDDITLGSATVIDLAGRELKFDGVQVPLPGGQLDVWSEQGGISLLAGSNVTVDSAGAAAAGAINLNAGNGSVLLEGTLSGKAAAGQNGGRLTIDANTLNFAAAVARASAGAFTGGFGIRQRGVGDLVLDAGSTIKSSSVSLTADQGAIHIAGTIDASSAYGGRVLIAARDSVDVSGRIDARATQATSAGRARIDLQSGGSLFIRPSALLDVTVPVSGPDVADGRGIVSLRLPRAGVLSVLDGDTTNDALQVSGTIRGTSSVIVEGYASYTDDFIDFADVMADVSNPIYADAQNFSNAAAGLSAALGANTSVRAGVEIVSPGDMHLVEDWDLAAWRFNGQPGVLTLRAGGDLYIDRSISDGFASVFDFVLPNVNSESWSYRLAAGADAASANALGLKYSMPGVGTPNSIIIAPGTPGDGFSPPDVRMIRTGTGSIDLAATGDLVFGNQASVIYTAGVKGSGIQYPGMAFDGGLNNLPYPHRGGDINIGVGRDIVGAPTMQIFGDWLWRTGCQQAETACNAFVSTAWTIAFDRFEQGVGALGGGNIDISAGGSIRDLWASSASIGRQIGSRTPDNNKVEVVGGGNVNVRANGDLMGGGIYVGRGKGRIDVLGKFGATTDIFGTTEISPILAIGDAQIAATARGDMRVDALINPMLMPFLSDGGNLNLTYFSTYTDASSASLLSLGGRMDLGNSSIVNNPMFGITNGLAQRLAPPTVSAISASGKLNVGGPLTLLPAPRGNLTLMARDDVTFRSATGGASTLIISDGDPTVLPTMYSAIGALSDQLAPLFELLTDARSTHESFFAPTPTHLGDPDPVRIVSAEGDVSFGVDSGSPDAIFSAKRLRVVAGRDILNINLFAQHVSAADVSSFIAGRDIRYSLGRQLNGSISPSLLQVNLGGPGQLELIAGRDVDLQTSGGITTDANIRNPALSKIGASVGIVAGLNSREPAYDAMIARYILNGAYDTAVVAYVKKVSGDTVTAEEARARFQLMPREQQRVLLQQILIAEIREGGRSAAQPGPTNNDFTRAFQALETYFPGSNPDIDNGELNPYAGDIRLYFSRVYTLQGGDISFFAPGGSVNAGLATPPSSYGIQKSAAELGVVARSAGDLSSISYGDFLVNESRYFAGDGGNILVWSTRGDIDAGRGAKTAISAPPPVITIDAQGQPRVVFPAAFTGSGIQTLATTQGLKPGNVDLFAPRGVVNAGDAGIVAGNLTIAATAVLGADNIQVSGVAVGVPVDTGGLGASLAGVSSVASSANAAADAAVDGNSGAKQTNTPLAETALSWLEVFIEGFGDDVCKASDLECLGRQKE